MLNKLDKTRSLCTIGLISIFAFFGAGCSSVSVSNLTPEQASAELTIKQGSEIVLRPTVLGVGGQIVNWIGGSSATYDITVSHWEPGVRATIGWIVTTREETPESIAQKKEYDATYSNSPIGTEIPDPPKTEYRDVTKSGSINAESLSDADTILLPDSWTQGDAGTVEETLIWLSRAQYNELLSSRSTRLSLGLFDESLGKVERMTDELRAYLDRASGILSKIGINAFQTNGGQNEDLDDLLEIKADNDWGTYMLMVDEVSTTVRTIEAHNSFGSYTILANPENPLILEARLTPLAQGSFELFSADGIMQGFSGYEIISIDR